MPGRIYIIYPVVPLVRNRLKDSVDERISQLWSRVWNYHEQYFEDVHERHRPSTELSMLVDKRGTNVSFLASTVERPLVFRTYV
jgi:hypothetical protein